MKTAIIAVFSHILQYMTYNILLYNVSYGIFTVNAKGIHTIFLLECIRVNAKGILLEYITVINPACEHFGALLRILSN